MVTIIITNTLGLIPFPSTGVSAFLGFAPFIGLLAVIFAFVDRSVLVAHEADFFHRDTLSWSKLRVPAVIALLGAMSFGGAVLSSPETNSNGPTPLVARAGFATFVIVLPLILSYGTAALIVAARRTPDRALKRSILLMGLALSTLVVSIVASLPFDTGSLPYVLVNEGTSVVGISLIYRSVMSLSPIGRIQKEESTAPAEGPKV